MAGVLLRMGFALVAAVIMAVSLGGKWVGAQVQTHHVVGGDRGWDSSSDVSSWSAGRVFRVGDKIWFTYSAAQESIAELKSKKEYESCDVSNPIRMYTEGLDVVPLAWEGIRYFVSSKTEHCKNGLKLHVHVMPKQSPDNSTLTTSQGSGMALAAGPTTPSASARFGASAVLGLLGFGLFYMSF